MFSFIESNSFYCRERRKTPDRLLIEGKVNFLYEVCVTREKSPARFSSDNHNTVTVCSYSRSALLQLHLWETELRHREVPSLPLLYSSP